MDKRVVAFEQVLKLGDKQFKKVTATISIKSKEAEPTYRFRVLNYGKMR